VKTGVHPGATQPVIKTVATFTDRRKPARDTVRLTAPSTLVSLRGAGPPRPSPKPHLRPCRVAAQPQAPPASHVEVHWEGGARTELSVPLRVPGKLEQGRIAEDTLELIRRLAEHQTDRQIAGILGRQGRRTGTGLPFTEARVRGVRKRAGIPAAPPADPAGELLTIEQAMSELGVSTHTIRRWINNGLLPAEQTTPGAPWRIRLTDEIRSRFVPDVPDGYVPLADAARQLGCARQTVLHKVQRGELHAIHVTNGQRRGLRIKVAGPRLDQLLND
jgi:excisionase family DNA binding protein